MRRTLEAGIAIGILGALIIGIVAVSGQANNIVYPSNHERLVNVEGTLGIVYPTATVEPTATDVPPTATATATETPIPSEFFDQWHTPQAHDGLNVHEHGHAPPQWVMDSPWPASFPSGPEAHQGFKGFYDPDGKDVDGDGAGDFGESYILGHIISSDAAHHVNCHSVKVWIKDTGDGVSYAEGINCFGGPDLVTQHPRPDTGHIFSLDDGGCESWYGDADWIAFDGWTICNRMADFEGNNLGGTGTFRTFEWIIYDFALDADEWIQVSPTLANDLGGPFSPPSIRFRVDSVEFDPAGLTEQPN